MSYKSCFLLPRCNIHAHRTIGPQVFASLGAFRRGLYSASSRPFPFFWTSRKSMPHRRRPQRHHACRRPRNSLSLSWIGFCCCPPTRKCSTNSNFSLFCGVGTANLSLSFFFSATNHPPLLLPPSLLCDFSLKKLPRGNEMLNVHDRYANLLFCSR